MAMKLLVALALLCPQSSEAACTGTSCLEDEVSLVQQKTVMKHAGNPVDWKAEVDAEPQTGAIAAAYSANKAKVEEPIASEAAEDLQFEDQVNNRIAHEKDEFNQALDEQNQDLSDAVAADNAKVQDTIDNRETVEDMAQDTVDVAKENYEAHEIKEDQAQDAAIAGSLAGRDAGDTQAANMKDDRDDQQYNAAEEKRIREEGEQIQADRRSDRHFVRNKVEEDVNTARDYVEQNGKDVARAKEKVASDTAASETAVEGPEGIYNQVTTDYADSEADAYGRDTLKSQQSIASAADAAWPKGQWPEEPNM